MNVVVAYLLSILAMPIVALVLMLPIGVVVGLAATAGPVVDRVAGFLTHAVSAFVMVLASSLIFGWLDAPFSLAPALVIGVLLTLFNVARLSMLLRAWGGYMESQGFSAQRSGDVLFSATMADPAARQTYRRIGDELAYALGGVAGVVAACWWFFW